MTVDLSKAEAGGVIEVRLDFSQVESAKISKRCIIYESQVLSYTPPAFDWATVKPGMAFLYEDRPLHFVGPNVRSAAEVIVTDNVGQRYMSMFKGILTRAPEHDIAVP